MYIWMEIMLAMGLTSGDSVVVASSARASSAASEQCVDGFSSTTCDGWTRLGKRRETEA